MLLSNAGRGCGTSAVALKRASVLAWAVSLTLAGGSLRAEFVQDIGTDGISGGAGTGAPGGNGTSATAVAGNVDDFDNTADARGGMGGDGGTPAVPGPTGGGAGGSGGDAAASALTEDPFDTFLSAHASATGGIGGTGYSSGNPGKGGDATSSAQVNSMTPMSFVFIDSTANAGRGGDSSGGTPTIPGAGGASSASANAAMDDAQLTVYVNSSAGWGGNQLLFNGHGGNGGSAQGTASLTSAGNQVDDSDPGNPTRETDLNINVNGGQGGTGFGAGFHGGNGGSAGASAPISATTTGTGDVWVKAYFNSGWGGDGLAGASGGNGANAMANNVITGSTTTGLLTIEQTTASGQGGGGTNGGSGGNGGDSVSVVSVTNDGGGATEVHSTTYTGFGGSPEFGVGTGAGGNGGNTTASATASSSNPLVSAYATANGASGGNAQAGTAAGGNAGSVTGFASASETGTAPPTEGATITPVVTANVTAYGGFGGDGMGGAKPGNGSVTIATATANSVTAGAVVHAEATAYGGTAGQAFSGTPASLGVAGSGTAAVNGSVGDGLFTGRALATGGWGTNQNSTSGHGGNAAPALVTANVTSAANQVTDADENNPTYEVDLNLEADGGQGGNATGAGFHGGTGGTAGVSAPISASTTGSGDVRVALNLNGGWGGNAESNAAGGNASGVTATNAMSGSTGVGGKLVLNQIVYGGGGGSGSGTGAGGLGGAAVSSLTTSNPGGGALDVTMQSTAGFTGSSVNVDGLAGSNAQSSVNLTNNAAVTAHVKAYGGQGGSSGNGNGGAGGTSSVSGTITSADAIVLDAYAGAGAGGNGVGIGKTGGAPTLGTLGTFNLTSTGNKQIDATVAMDGGNGGSGFEGANAASGGNVSLNNAVTGTTSGLLHTLQYAYGGSGGRANGGGTPGTAGNATSTFNVTRNVGSLQLQASSFGGMGGSSDGTVAPKIGGSATSTANGSHTAGGNVDVTAESYGGRGGDNDNGNGALPGSSFATGSATTSGDAGVHISANGGGGGNGGGIGFHGADGNLPTWSFTPATSTGGGTATTHLQVGGGWGGDGTNGAGGGNGASVSLTNLVSASTTGKMVLHQDAYGGGGGSVFQGAALPGNAGSASSSLTFNRATPGDVEIHAVAVGNSGGSAWDASTADGTAGGVATATGGASGQGKVDVYVEGWGGWGGSAQSGNGGAGSLPTLTQANATSTGDDVSTRVVRSGGGGGSATDGGNAGAAADASLSNFPTATTIASKAVYLEQNVYTNAGGAAVGGGNATRGGDAASVLGATKSQSDFFQRATTFAGTGGYKDFTDGTAGRGGNATSSADTANTTGTAHSDMYAGAGKGGDGYSGANAGDGGNGTSTSVAHTTAAGMKATANGGAVGGEGGDIQSVPLSGPDIVAGNAGSASITGTATADFGPAEADVFAISGRGGTYLGGAPDPSATSTPRVSGGTGGSATANVTGAGNISLSAHMVAARTAVFAGDGGAGHFGGDGGQGGDATAITSAVGGGEVQSSAYAVAGKGGLAVNDAPVIPADASFLEGGASGIAYGKASGRGTAGANGNVSAHGLVDGNGRVRHAEANAFTAGAGTNVVEASASIGRVHPAVPALGADQAFAIVTGEPGIADLGGIPVGLRGLMGNGTEGNILARMSTGVTYTAGTVTGVQEVTARPWIGLDASKFEPNEPIYAGFYMSQAVNLPIESLQVDVIGHSWKFASLADANAFFADHPVDVTGAIQYGGGDIQFSVVLRSPAAGAAIKTEIVVGTRASTTNEWSNRDGGSFNDPLNWSQGAVPADGSPSAPAVVNLLRAGTPEFGGDQFIDLPSDVTFSVLNADADWSYHLGGPGALQTSNAPGSLRQINVMNYPSLFIDAPFKLRGDLTVSGDQFSGIAYINNLVQWDAGVKVTVGSGALALEKNVGPSPTIGAGANVSVRPGAIFHLLGTVDSMSNGANRVSVVNDSPATGFTDAFAGLDVQQGAFNIGSLTGVGNVYIRDEARLTADVVRQAKLIFGNQGRLDIRAAASPTTSYLKQIVDNGSFQSGRRDLDINNNRLVLDYDGGSPLIGTRGRILNGYHGGAWNGENGPEWNILSTSAANDALHRTAVGYGEASVLLGLTGGATANWFGQIVDSTSLLIRYTYYGDANLNGVVDRDDYAILDKYFARHLVAGEGDWTRGDFNYDGLVNVADYQLADKSFALQSGGLDPILLAERESQFGSEYVSQLIAAVPEPSMAGLLIAAMPMMRRRRPTAPRGRR